MEASEAAALAAELAEAIALYEAQLAELRSAAAGGGDGGGEGDGEAAQLVAQLEQALADARAAAADLPAPPPPQQQPQHQHPSQRPPLAESGSGGAGGSGTVGRAHPDSAYFAREPDFAALAERYPYLRPHLRHPAPGGRAALDWQSWHATAALTRALLHADYGVEWALPEGQLVPPVPNRANYIHWVTDLLRLSSPPGPGAVRGLDVGCGANYIYCLLGAAIHGWHMVGVDVTEVALAAAAANRAANPHLAPLLEVRRGGSAAAAAEAAAAAAAAGEEAVAASKGSGKEEEGDEDGVGPILTAALRGPDERFHFCMCNPPFFESMDEAGRNPRTACGGTAEEMVCPGGELAFVLRMARESAALRDRVHWYSAMLGKKSTLKALRAELAAAGGGGGSGSGGGGGAAAPPVVRTTELKQGRTARWAVAWSFAAARGAASAPLRGGGGGGGSSGGAQAGAASTAAANGGGGERAATAAAVAPAAQLPLRAVTAMSFSLAAPQAEGARVLAALAALLGRAVGSSCAVDKAAWAVTAALPPRAPEDAAAGGGANDGGGDVQSAKRQRTASDGGKGGGSGGDVAVRASVSQQQRGRFVVAASIPAAAGAAAARRFTDIMAEVRDDMALMWRLLPE